MEDDWAKEVPGPRNPVSELLKFDISHHAVNKPQVPWMYRYSVAPPVIAYQKERDELERGENNDAGHGSTPSNESEDMPGEGEEREEIKNATS